MAERNDEVPPQPVEATLPAASEARMARFFNTAGPNRPEHNYTLPALARIPTAFRIVARQGWFVVHAPRQSGKTTAMRALAEALTASGQVAALWTTCEAAEPWSHDPGEANLCIIDGIRARGDDLPQGCRPPPVPKDVHPGQALEEFLRRWAQRCERPIVLLLDEIDALRDEALISVLRQLRAVYPERPEGAPMSVALIGLRDVRDYKLSEGDRGRLGTSSPFNVKVKAVTLSGFSREDIAALYGQHTAEMGQAFEPEAIDRVWQLTQGQPWLVNAMAAELIDEMAVDGPIQAVHVETAKERLILTRATHLDSLADKLREPRVRAVVAPILAGEQLPLEIGLQDIEFCEDLGLVRRSRSGIEIANPIYREVLPRELAEPALIRIVPPTSRWQRDDGGLDMDALLAAFLDFWRQHGEWMVRGQSWPEAAHQIVLMAFLQRLLNGGGAIEREYGLGRRRLDLLIRWHLERDRFGAAIREERHVIEVKVWRAGRADPLAEGLEQLDAYLTRLGLEEGTLVIFDARTDAVAQGEACDAQTPEGRPVRLVRA